MFIVRNRQNWVSISYMSALVPGLVYILFSLTVHEPSQKVLDFSWGRKSLFIYTCFVRKKTPPFSYPSPLLNSTFTPIMLNIATIVWKSNTWAHRGKWLLWPRAEQYRRKVNNQKDLITTPWFFASTGILVSIPQRQHALEQPSGWSNLLQMTIVLWWQTAIWNYLEHSSTHSL